MYIHEALSLQSYIIKNQIIKSMCITFTLLFLIKNNRSYIICKLHLNALFTGFIGLIPGHIT